MMQQINKKSNKVMHDLSQEQDAGFLSIVEQYRVRALGEDMVLQVVEGQAFIFPKNEPKSSAVAKQNAGGEDAEERRKEAHAALQQHRAGWPRKARDLPDNTIMLSKQDMITALIANADPKTRAFHFVMKRLHEILNDPLMSPNGEPLPAVRPIEPDVRDALAVWGIEVPAAMMNPVSAPIFHNNVIRKSVQKEYND